MRGLRLERPPRWGIVALLVLVVANAALFLYMERRPAAADPYTPVADTASTAPTAPTPAVAAQSSASDQRPAASAVLAVYGDGYAAGNELGGMGAHGWPALVAHQVGATLQLHAVSRAGFVGSGTSGQTLLDMVRAEPVTDASVTVIAGGRSDADQPKDQVEAGVAAAVAAAKKNAPGTTVLVIGPIWSNGTVPDSETAVRDAVESAATEAGVTFLDPLKSGWFAQPDGLIASDAVSPTDAGHAYLAKQIAPAVQAALAAAGHTTG